MDPTKLGKDSVSTSEFVNFLTQSELNQLTSLEKYKNDFSLNTFEKDKNLTSLGSLLRNKLEGATTVSTITRSITIVITITKCDTHHIFILGI